MVYGDSVMEIRKIPIDKINPAPYNPRKDLKPGDPEYEKLKRSMQEFGYVEPIVWNKRTGNIVGGHQRYKVLLDMGMSEVDCVVVDLDETKEKALNLALNKIQGDWDYLKLKDILQELDTGAFDLELTGFDMEEIEDLVAQFHVPEEIIEDEAPEPPEEAITKPGDLWILGRHRLLCGDATKKEDVERLMDGKKADMIFTDPPYGVDYKGINNDGRDGLEELLRGAFGCILSTSKSGASCYVFHSDRCADIFHRVYREFFHFSSTIIWVKNSLTLSRTDYQSKHEPCLYGWTKGGTHAFYGDRRQTSVWECDKQRVEGHTTPKPIGIISKALYNSSKSGDIIQDLFGGSGSTLIACEQLNRICYMMEIDPVYCDVIVKRWENLTGQKAVLAE